MAAITETNVVTSPCTDGPRLVGTREKNVGWYQPTLSNVSDVQRDLLENYSHIPRDEVIPHILQIRDQAWEIHPYPCIGQFRFIDLCLSRSASYLSIISRLQNGASLLDIGCCFAQDLRKLVHDGAPSNNLYGAELKDEFITLSYDLFRDRSTFKAHFIQADIFEDGGSLEPLKGKMDVVQAGLFLHLFDLEGQTKACERIVGLLKPEKGVLFTGQQVGAVVPQQLPPETGSRMYKHNAESFAEMWRMVGERTGSEWVVRAHLDAGLGIGQNQRRWDAPTTRRLVFEVERIA